MFGGLFGHCEWREGRRTSLGETRLEGRGEAEEGLVAVICGVAGRRTEEKERALVRKKKYIKIKKLLCGG